MTRLTNNAREKIVKMILDRKFDPLGVALAKREYALAARFYERLYSPEQRAAMSATEALIKGAFGTQTAIKVSADGWKLSLYFGPPVTSGKDRLALLFSKRDYDKYDALVMLDGEDPLAVDFKQFALDQKAQKDERDTLQGQLNAQVGSFYTYEKLSEAWPEIEPFVTAVERGLATAVIGVPTIVNREALNAALDLPPDDTPTDAIATPKKV